ncbi:putative Translation initiation factor eIF3 subunit [Trypanosoma vivax]|uniref:Uncharacterized protein n=1 Tax=Trypanosoma vivax (strain Y486) TaxID=1055687 RepID=G0TSP3_TRYVY|nr:hypothetical protein TRVL_01199 [Trypanosoma vivax]KAH8605633.1 putative Translation initiation factor eIF3 subunit [Trypanosoma vivax]CCC46970.1 conserved hypothetical protein [Trypanosoma vivax Y486]
MSDYEEFDDAADDWEAEWAEEEEREKKLLEEQKKMEELKVQKRIRPSKRMVVQNDDEYVLEEGVAKALADISTVVGSLRAAQEMFHESDDFQLISSMPCTTAEEAANVGVAIAQRVLEFREEEHFNAIIHPIFREIPRRFKTLEKLNAEIARLQVVKNEVKRKRKEEEKKKEKKGEKKDEKGYFGGEKEGKTEEEGGFNGGIFAGAQRGDALGFDHVVDQGGAAEVPEGDENFI